MALKTSTINPPFWAVKEIASKYLEEFLETVEEYKSLLNDEIEEELEDGSIEEIQDPEEELNERFNSVNLERLLQEKLWDSADYIYMSMPKIPLKNKKAERILYKTDIYLKAEGGSTRGSISFVGPSEVVMKLYPCSILDSLLGIDFDNVFAKFKSAFYGTIRHELIHAIHFAYEHAELEDHLIDTKEEDEDEEEYYDYYEDYDEGTETSNFEYYKRHRYAPPGKKPKSLPWDSEINLKINPPTDYHNNRFERETHPSDLALASFERLLKYAKDKFKNKEDLDNFLISLPDRTKGDFIMQAFKYHPVQSSFLTGTQTYNLLIRKENRREFLNNAFKSLNHIISEFVERNS